MEQNKQVLDVTFGNFSCRLEGFDDSVATMKVIVSYFHDLAGHKGFISTTADVSDLQTLTALAEDTTEGAVEVSLDGNKLNMTAQQDDQSVATDDAEDNDQGEAAASALMFSHTRLSDEIDTGPEEDAVVSDDEDPIEASDTIVETIEISENAIEEEAPTPEDTPVEDDFADLEEAEVAVADQEDVVAEEEDEEPADPIEEANEAAEMDDAAFEDAHEAEAAPEKVVSAEEAEAEAHPEDMISVEEEDADDEYTDPIEEEPEDDSLTARLNRIRAVVDQSAQTYSAQSAEAAEEDEGLEDSVDTDNHVEDPMEEVAEQSEPEIEQAQSAPPEIRAKARSNPLAHRLKDLARRKSYIRMPLEGPSVFDEFETQDDDAEQDTGAEAALLDDDPLADDNAHTMKSVTQILEAANTGSGALPDSFDRQPKTRIIEVDETETEEDVEPAHTADQEDEPLVLAAEDLEPAEAPDVAETAEDAPFVLGQDMMEPAEAEEEPDAAPLMLDENMLESDPETDDESETADLSTLIMRSRDALGSHTDTLLKAAARAEQDDDFDLGAEIAKVEAEIAARNGNEVARHGLPRHVEDAMSRIFSETNQHLEDPAARRNRDAFAQLKAAVAATEAARRLEEYEDHNPSRDHGENEYDAPLEDTSSQEDEELPPLQLVSDDLVDDTEDGLDLRAALEGEDDLDDEFETNIFAEEPQESSYASKPSPLAKPEHTIGDPNDPASQRLRKIAARKEAEGEVEETGFAEFADHHGATSNLVDMMEAAGAFICFEQGENEFSRPQLIKVVQSAIGRDVRREDGLRSFGRLLRQGRFTKTESGRFQIAADSRFGPNAHQAARG